MPYGESPNSFLFGLNQFTSPPADSPSQTGGNASRSDNMLASLEAFASEDMTAGSSHNDAIGGQAPNFADQLALWTNANFSFDGPTGHALLGDEEKEKEEAEHNRRREDENRRNQEEERERLARNAAASSRGSNALRGKARDTGSSQPEASGSGFGPASQPHLGGPAHQHPQHAQPPQAQHQPQPQSQHHHQQQQQASQHQPFFPGAPHFANASRPPPGAGPSPATNNAFPPFLNGFAGLSQLGGLAAPQHNPFQNGLAGLGSLDMTSALALQHLLASNPLALAGLSQLAGLTNPQIQSQLAGLASGAAGGVAAHQQSPAAPSPAANPNGNAALPSQNAWLAAQPQGSSRASSFSGVPAPQPSSNWPGQMATLPGSSGSSLPPTLAPASNGMHATSNGTDLTQPTTSSVPELSNSVPDDSSAPQHQQAFGTASTAGSDTASGSAAKKKRTSTSEGKKPQIDADPDEEDILGKLEDIERRYEIPPLKLIDTGNPEADAEANRHAIEEDKRRRNTAASARFRIKKKQREAALEQAAKELQQRLADLETENARLRTENGWLKSLITVRPDQAMPGGLDQSAVPNPFSSAGPAVVGRGAAAAGPSGTPAPAFGAALASHPPTANGVGAADGASSAYTADHAERHSGLHPRGVGTDAGKDADASKGSSHPNGASANGNKRDREE
ncbi:hypothetical protein BCV70DRAFT_68657 [Testicularia cyperi]|uniref:BZIP domain-containing protein n=1 Tax=Testicularia cyperi TaxID=1882483 RepID=A0A317XG96_9BASI|nr:hypothetical protein BCV70DRAFT_68657 [Testicularia cyperi]